MREGIVSVGTTEEEQITEEHVPLTVRDLDVMNQALSSGVVNRLREGSRFIVTARSHGLQAGFDEDGDGSITVYGLKPQVVLSAEEALSRGWESNWLDNPDNFKDFESIEFYTFPG